MVKTSLKRVFIKNFKSLHDCEIDVRELNVVVGANASGKSNLVEVFRLLKKIYVDKDINPFSEWWGYDNAVWGKNEELPVTIGLDFVIEGYDVYFESTFTGVGGSFRILREVLDLKGYAKFEKEGEFVNVNNNKNFVKKVLENMPDYASDYGGKKRLRRVEKNILSNGNYISSFRVRLLDKLGGSYWYSSEYTNKKNGTKLMLVPIKFHDPEEKKKDEFCYVLCPGVEKNKYGASPLFFVSSEAIISFIESIVLFYPLNIRSMKKPQPFKREEKLVEDGSNIANVFHSIYLKEGKIPDDIYNPLSIIFPNTEVRPKVTEDGRVYIIVYEDGLEFNPPNVSDGLYKILTILTAIYLKPPLLVVDELENSLHPETLELVLDTIKTSEVCSIITTHSPIMVDMTEPEDIVLIEKEDEASKFKRPEDPEKIRKFLNEKQITFSEGWIYGDLFKTEQKT